MRSQAQERSKAQSSSRACLPTKAPRAESALFARPPVRGVALAMTELSSPPIGNSTKSMADPGD